MVSQIGNDSTFELVQPVDRMSLRKEIKIALHRVLIGRGLDIRNVKLDRKLLETQLIPEILRTADYQRILFVGCAWYTLHYPDLFRGRDFTTMEIDPAESRFGARKHIVDSCTHIADHFKPDSLDVIILNGVYGFGLNQHADIEATLIGIHTALRCNGLFIFGWNDTPATTPVPVDRLIGLRAFQPYRIPGLGVERIETDPRNRHRFEFYLKPKESDVHGA